jgi:hypothetical protein
MRNKASWKNRSSRERSLEDQTRDRQEAQAQKAPIFARIASKQKASAVAKSIADEPMPASQGTKPAETPDSKCVFQFPRLLAHLAPATCLHLQPWTEILTSTLMERAKDKNLSLRLLWPLEIRTPVQLHAMASLSRALGHDLQGLRTLYYPGTNATRIALDRLTMDRSQLGALRSALWSGDVGRSVGVRASRAFEALLTACNDIYHYKSDEPPPQLRDLIPTFIFDKETLRWTSPQLLPLERQLRKVPKLARRRDLRKQIDAEWRSSASAPGALLVVPRSLRRKEWRALCAESATKSRIKPEALLIDATIAAMVSDQNSVRRVPEFLQTIREKLGDVGGLIVTDDPGLFFTLERQLAKFDIKADSLAIAAEAEPAEVFVAEVPKRPDWVPHSRAAVNFSVSILDAEAAAVALKFNKIADKVREDEPALENAFRDAQRFLLRLSHLPAGFIDLQSADSEEQEFLQSELQWLRVEDPILQALREGRLNEFRAQIAEAIDRAKEMIGSCAQGTPLALHLKEQVRRFASKSGEGITILLQSRFDIAVAQRFLSRTMGKEWEAVQSRVEWLRYADAWAALNARTEERRLFVVGLSRSVVRFVLTHEEIPRGTNLLVPVQRAIGMAYTLRGMMRLDALKPYKARTGALLAMLDQRLDSIGNLEMLSKHLASVSMSTKPPNASSSEAADPHAYRITLEDGRRIYVAGFVYRYDTGDDTRFTRVQVKTLEVGDLIFEMSETLRDEVEEALELRSEGGAVLTSPHQKVLAMYHREVSERVLSLFPAPTRTASVRLIKARILDLAEKAIDVTESQIQYWVNLKADETTPHGAREQGHFLLFCSALNIDGPASQVYWQFIRRARHSNQSYGRYLAGRYAEILFQPESAEVYRKMSSGTIERLRLKAYECVYQIIAITEPAEDVAKKVDR